MKRVGWIFLFLVATAELCALSHEVDPQIYSNEYGKYRLPKEDRRPAVTAIKEGAVWERATLRTIAEHYKKGSAIVHAGTYFGDMLPFFSQLVGQEGKVWAFEPVALNYECAVETVRLNGLKNVDLRRAALSERKGELWMKTRSESHRLGGGSTVVESVTRNPGDSFERVPAIALDDLLAGSKLPIGVIHLDIEGHEAAALRGARKTIALHRPILVLEVSCRKQAEMTALTSAMGYTKVATVNMVNAVYFPNELVKGQ